MKLDFIEGIQALMEISIESKLALRDVVTRKLMKKTILRIASSLCFVKNLGLVTLIQLYL
jgi:hypothetical protein